VGVAAAQDVREVARPRPAPPAVRVAAAQDVREGPGTRVSGTVVSCFDRGRSSRTPDRVVRTSARLGSPA